MSQTIRRPAILAGVVVALLSSYLPAQTTAPAATFGVNDPAPALKIGKWYKGAPVPSFERGHTYVVEFWATWCGPCKVSIPHLTTLQKQYAGKVTFIGVDILEEPDTNTAEDIDTLVAPFVTKMGEQMDYTVAADGPDHWVAQHWYQAAGLHAIPTAFVVMPDGKIGWNGHPNGLTAVLPKVLAGTWDPAAERKRIDDDAATSKPHRDALAKIIPARKTKDYPAVLAACDEAVARSPDLAKQPDMMSYTLEALFNTDAKRAVAYVKDLYAPGGLVASNGASNWDVFRVLEFVPPTSPMTPADWKAIAAVMDPSIANTTKLGYGNFTGYAEVLWRGGDHELAAFYQNKGVNILLAWNDAHKSALTQGNIDSVKHQQARLHAMAAGLSFSATQPTN